MFFQIVYHFLLVGNGDTIMSRLSVVTWTRHFLPSPLPSIACLALMVMFCIYGRHCPHMIPQLDWISHQLRLAVESWQNTNPLNKGVRKNLTPLLSDSSWITQEGSYVLSHSLVGPFVFQLMSPIQQELLNRGVRVFLTPLLTRSTRITQQGG